MDKKRILIIGASSAIGCELIRQIDDENIIILAHYNSNRSVIDALLLDTIAEIIPFQADLSNEAGPNSIIEAAVLHYGYPDKIIFLAAPNLILARFKDVTWNDFKTQIDLQLYTAYIILQAFLPKMASAKYGKVVFMLSNYTIGIPPSAMAHYVTGKYTMLGLMNSLSAEFASKQICINSVSPSMIETGFLSHIPDKLIEFTAQQHPLKRNGKPAEVASVIKFLLSDESSYLTGVNIPITGGI
jgi:3-oxoacyl-[acyl-carrier protein] reductase